jgi:hypothetical protein
MKTYKLYDYIYKEYTVTSEHDILPMSKLLLGILEKQNSRIFEHVLSLKQAYKERIIF